MEFSILYAIQSMRTPWLDSFFLYITNMAGDMGQLWVIAGVLLLFYKKTRKIGFAMLISYGMVYGVGQYVLKDLIARPRPCHIDTAIELIVKRPSSYSCPSTHSGWAFAAATSVYLNNKKAGYLIYIIAALIAFSRMYMFVHFPTDVLFGIVLGILFGFLSAKIIEFADKKVHDME